MPTSEVNLEIVATGKQAKEEALVGSSETKEAYFAVPLEWSSRARHHHAAPQERTMPPSFKHPA
jgi:hypothetical protein